MAGKLHCVKNKERTDKFCSHAHPWVSVGLHSFNVLLRVSALLKKVTEIAWKVSKTKENKRLNCEIEAAVLFRPNRKSPLHSASTSCRG